MRLPPGACAERILVMLRFVHGFRRLWLAGLLALAGAMGTSFLLAGIASAHASYVSSDPAAGAVVATAPTTVTVHFAENVNPQGSSLVVYHETDAKNIYSFDQEAKTVSTGQAQFPLSDAKSMTITMQGDGDGIYAVFWKTVSADDGDPDSGVFFFGVGTGNVLGTGSAAASTPTASGTSTGSGTSAAISGVSIWVPIVVGILALLFGGALGVWFARRMSLPGGGQPPAPVTPDPNTAGRR